MTPADRSRVPSRRRSAPAVEGLESRALLSFVTVFHAHGMSPRLVRAEAVSGIGSGGGSGSSGGAGNAGTTATPLPSNQAPNLGAPSPAEAAKQRFLSKTAGTFVTQPGRFAGQTLQGLILATGGSNQSLRLNLQMQFFDYADPAQPPTGQIDESPKNVSSTGTALILDLTAVPNSLSHGALPTRFTYTVNGGSAGLYTGATGQGTVDVHYNLYHRPSGVRSGGTATVVVQGTVVTNHGLTLDTATPGNRPRNGI